METLLTTKLHIPPARPELVTRPRLLEQLNQGLQCKLTLISAPAGFGKTTLVREWVEALRLPAKNEQRSKERQSYERIAWLSLDESDNDPTSFLSYLIAAVRTIQGNFAQEALSALNSPQPPPVEATLTSLLNEFAALPGAVLLVFDDYHHIDSPQVDEAVGFLLAHLPQQVHLVIATRVDPQLPLARLRARCQLTELRAADLRFTSAEAAEFLNRLMGLDLSEGDIAALENRTEGWIAGLQLAAISLQDNHDTARRIRSFTGSHRFVLDYLIEEVLEQQPKNIQAFLLQTALLNRLNGSLCDALTGQGNGQATLEKLDRLNLFIIPLDEERRWYRYHQLFADLLRQRLRQTQSERVAGLHQRASAWYVQNGFADEAIEHALRAEDFERAGDLIEKRADAAWSQGKHGKLRSWLFQLPAEWITARPELCIFHAWYLFAGGQHAAAGRSLGAVEDALAANGVPDKYQAPLTTADKSQLQGRLAAIRAFMDSHRGDVPGMIRHANLALETLPKQDLTWRSLAAITLGDVQGFKGDMNAAYAARLEALRTCQAAGETYYILLASMKLAITLRSQGRLEQTVELVRQQIRLAEECGFTRTSLYGLLLAIEGEVLAETDHLEQALERAQQRAALVEQSVEMVLRGWGDMCLARILFSSHDLAGVQAIVQKVERISRETRVPGWVLDQMACWQARAWIASDNLEAAWGWAQERGLALNGQQKPQLEIDYFSLVDYLVLARIMLAQGRLEESAGLLENLLAAAEAGGRTARVIEILMLQALAEQAMEKTARAMHPLGRALQLAEPEGFVRVFVDEGPLAARLLMEAARREIAPQYTRRLLAAFPASGAEPPVPAPVQTTGSEWIEPLSGREKEVLLLIAQGLNNPEIADRLYLSLNTVKVHTRNIFAKLNVHSRTQALARAQALGLLPADRV